MNRSFLRGLSFALGLSLVGGLSFSSSDAFAKKKDKGSETEAEEAIEIVVTNIKAIDDVFAPAGAMLTSLKTAQDGIKAMNTGIVTAMGLPEGTPVADALAELKKAAPGMLTVKMDGMKPKVDVKPEAPENVKKAVESINAGGEGIVAAIKAMTEIPEQIKTTVDAAKALPAQVPTIAKDAGLKPTEIPKLVKTVGGNVKAVAQIPEQAKSTGGAAKASVEIIKGLGG